MDRRSRLGMLADAMLAVAVGLVGIAEVWVPFDSVQGTGSPVVSTIGIVICAVLLAFRRAKPIVLVGLPLTWVVLGLITAADVQTLFFGQLVPLYLALFSATRYGSRRVVIAVCAAIAGTVALADLFVPELQGPSEMLFHWGVFLAVFGVGWGLRLSEKRAVAAGARAAEAEAKAREERLRAVAEERSRIARELHDILGHSVSVMVVQAGAASQAIDDDPDFARRAIEAIRSTGTQALDEVRRVVALLRDTDEAGTAPQPGLADLGSLIERAEADGLHVSFAQHGDASALGTSQQLAVYRIVQEGLTNVRKHAGPRAIVTVTVHHGSGATEVEVADDGARRQRLAQADGHGLVGMRERVALYGGSVDAGPGREGGWRVHAVVPVTVGAAAGGAP